MNSTARVSSYFPFVASQEEPESSGLWVISIGLLLLLVLTQQLGLVGKIQGTIWKRIQSFQYLLKGTSIIQSYYDKGRSTPFYSNPKLTIVQCNGKPFEVFAPDNRYVFVSSDQQIKELDAAPDTVLSLQAAAKQMLQPIYTMSRFNWFNVRGTEGVGFLRTLRTMLTNNIPIILPELSSLNTRKFENILERQPAIKGSIHCHIYPAIVEMVVLSNAVSFFGADLAKNEVFLDRARAYIEETLICAEIVRLLPNFLAPMVGKLIGRRLSSQDVIFNTLLPIAEERCEEREVAKLGRPVPKHARIFQGPEKRVCCTDINF